MDVVAIVAYSVYMALVLGLRVLLQWRWTGSTGLVGVTGRPGSAEWVAGVLFATAMVLGLSAPVLALADLVEPLEALDSGAVQAVGIVLFTLGLVGTFAAQLAMGASWRVGVDQQARTELVTGGPFALVRNPIFAAALPAWIGLTLMVPSVLAIASLVVLFTSLELAVRVVEEPYLLRTHGEAYASYAARVGRFVPGVGRLGSR